jgi:hypothetical protein
MSRYSKNVFKGGIDKLEKMSDNINTVTDNKQIAITSPKGLDMAFFTVYKVLVVFAVIIVFVHYMTCSIDLTVYYYNKNKLNKKMKVDPNIINKDTMLYKGFHYAEFMKKKEPYNIYLRQELVKTMYSIISFTIFVLCLQIGIFFGLKLLSLLRSNPFNETISIPYKNIITMVILFIFAYIYTKVYNNLFIDRIQPDLLNSKSNIENIKNYIYDNMTKDQKFLNALLRTDTRLLIDYMNKASNEYSLMKMLFTISLYEYYRKNVKSSSDEYKIIEEIFSVKQIDSRTINPVEYFYYKRSVFLPDIYNLYKIQFKETFKPDLLYENDSINLDKEYEFVGYVGSVLNKVNKDLLTLNKIPKHSNDLFKYIYYIFIISTVLIIIYGTMYKDAFKSFIDVIKRLFNSLKSVADRNK